MDGWVDGWKDGRTRQEIESWRGARHFGEELSVFREEFCDDDAALVDPELACFLDLQQHIRHGPTTAIDPDSVPGVAS
eukprot:1583060-Rhodomonas_salina.8